MKFGLKKYDRIVKYSRKKFYVKVLVLLNHECCRYYLQVRPIGRFTRLLAEKCSMNDVGSVGWLIYIKYIDREVWEIMLFYRVLFVCSINK